MTKPPEAAADAHLRRLQHQGVCTFMITIPTSDLVLELSGGVTMSFITIPAGQFRMGSREYYEFEEPIHTVHITSPFYLGTYPVTQAQFAAWRPEHQNLFPNNPSHPAEQMTWQESAAALKDRGKPFSAIPEELRRAAIEQLGISDKTDGNSSPLR